MATEFKTRVGHGKYMLQFETDNKEHYLLMQETARRCVDGKSVTRTEVAVTKITGKTLQALKKMDEAVHTGTT